MEDTKVTTRHSSFHSANKMQEVGGALEHLAMAEGANRDIVPNLKEAVEQLKNASLTTQISDATKLNLEMDKKLNLNATQGQDT